MEADVNRFLVSEKSFVRESSRRVLLLYGEILQLLGILEFFLAPRELALESECILNRPCALILAW